MVPIIENTPEEKDLKERMARAMEEYPDSCAVLVRRHGVYVWGESWEKAKTMWDTRPYTDYIIVYNTAAHLCKFSHWICSPRAWRETLLKCCAVVVYLGFEVITQAAGVGEIITPLSSSDKL